MIYFDNASTSHPKAPGVADAVRELLNTGCFNINRGAYAGAQSVSDLVYDAREKLAAFFGCPSGRNVVFTGGITQSLNMALKGLLRPGDRVVTTQMEHNAVMRPLAQLQSLGVIVDFARCDSGGTLDLDDMRDKIRGGARLVVMTHASNVCGTVAPVAQVGEFCREFGALLLVDSAQTAGVLPVSMLRDNIDILAFTGHKSLLAAPGTGGLILPQEVADMMTPLLAGGTGSYSHSFDMPAELPDRFEAGTLNLPGIAALSVSLDYIRSVGIGQIHSHEMALLERLTEKLRSVAGVRIVGQGFEKCAVAALDFPGRDNADIASLLDGRYGIMTRCGLHCAPAAHRTLGTYPRGALRCSFGFSNTGDEVDEFVHALTQILVSG